jgi:hypothetical protein
MPDDAYVLSEETYERLMDLADRTGNLPPRRELQAQRRAAVRDIPHNWVKVTSTTPSTITLTSGTISGYAAVLSQFDPTVPGYSDTSIVVWFYPPNGATPTLNQRYECRGLGADTSGVTIWGTDISSGGSSGIALKDKTGATVDAACTSLKADADGVLTFSHLAANSDQIVITDASPTQRGVVNTTTQEFAGLKTFDNQATFKGGIEINANGSYPGVDISAQSFPGSVSLAFLAPGSVVVGTLKIVTSSNPGILQWNSLAIFGGSIQLGGGPPLATGATTGFPAITAMNGQPTGVPDSAGGDYAPMVWDRTNKKLWIYDTASSTWKGVVLT